MRRGLRSLPEPEVWVCRNHISPLYTPPPGYRVVWMDRCDICSRRLFGEAISWKIST